MSYRILVKNGEGEERVVVEGWPVALAFYGAVVLAVVGLSALVGAVL